MSPALRNEWDPPDRKVDTRKYRAEPRSIFDYEPGKSSILEQERAVSSLLGFSFKSVIIKDVFASVRHELLTF